MHAYIVEELAVEHIELQPMPRTIEDIIADIADRDQRIAAFYNLVQGV